MNEYEINENTLAVIPKKQKSVVYENKETFIVNKTANKIMEDSCEYFGSSLEGRQKGTTSLIGISHKAPIIIEESKELIFFPTTSPRLTKCSWISLSNIEKYYRHKNKLIIEFKNHKTVELDVSFGIIDNQYLRATKLGYVLRQRKNEKT